MQNLMHGLTKSLSKLDMVKVLQIIAKIVPFLINTNFSIERVGGQNYCKYRKSYLINEFLKNNKNINCVITDHWKSLENIKTNKKICLIHLKKLIIKKLKTK